MSIRRAALVALLLALSCIGCASVSESATRRLERKMMFHPLKVKRDAPVPEGVESVWIPGELIETTRLVRRPPNPLPLREKIKTPVELHGVLAEAPRPAARRAAILYCHGNAGCVDGRADQILTTAEKFNATILAFDYRGFGRSAGEPDAAGIVADARAARLWLARREKIEERDVVLIGESLGGAVAVELAAEDGCRGLVLLSTFSSLADVAEEVAPAFLNPREIAGDRFNSVEAIRRYPGMLLQRHGDADEVIPIAQGRKLFDAAPGVKHFVTVPGGGHDSGGTPEFYESLENFFQHLPPERKTTAEK